VQQERLICAAATERWSTCISRPDDRKEQEEAGGMHDDAGPDRIGQGSKQSEHGIDDEPFYAA
jgi:hypothetical protein